MFEEVVLLACCALIAVAGLAVAVWEATTGRLFSMDGLWLTLISLTLAVVFGGNVAWSVYNGDVQKVLRHFRKRPVESPAAEKKPLGSA